MGAIVTPTNISTPGAGTYIALKDKVKQSKNSKINLLPTIRTAQSILKCKFRSIDKPPHKYAPQKGPLKNIFSEFYGTSPLIQNIKCNCRSFKM